MEGVAMTEAQYVRDLGEVALETLAAVGQVFENQGTKAFTGQEVADFLFVRATNLHDKFQARIDELEAN